MSGKTWEAPPEGSICWIEIPARDADRLKTFYEAVFPSWEFKPEVRLTGEDGRRTHMYTFKRPNFLSGGIVEMPKNCPPHSQSMGAGFTNYYLVDDVDEFVAKVEKAGGKCVLGKQPEGESGMHANVVDPDGNRFGVYQYLG